MTYTRRDFLETTGAVFAAGLGGASAGCSKPQPPPASAPAIRLSGAPGVEIKVDGTALPDYSRDLERYLVRLTNEARDRRKGIIGAISTRQHVLDRQKLVVSELWKMLGGPFE